MTEGGATRTREQHARRALARQRFVLSKSRRRDPRAFDYGRYEIRTPAGRVVATLPTLEAVEAWIDADPDDR